MKLQEFVESLPTYTLLHIGSNSGLFFIGTVEEYYRDIDSVWFALSEYYSRQINKRNQIIENSSKEDLVNLANKNRNIYQQKLSMCVDLRGREVLDSYPSIIDDGIVVKVSGVESNNVWFKEEYDLWRDMYGKK